MMFRGFSFCTRFGTWYLISNTVDRSVFETHWPDFDPEPVEPAEAEWILATLEPDPLGSNDDLRRFWQHYGSERFSVNLAGISDHQLYRVIVEEACGPFARGLNVHRKRGVEQRLWCQAAPSSAGGPGVSGIGEQPAVTPSQIARRQVAPSSALARPAPPKWIQDVLKIMCPKDKAFLDGLRARGVKITAYDRIYFDDPYYDGTKWTINRFEAGGTTSDAEINMIRSSVARENAATIFHEGVHTAQPDTMPWREKEYEAYIEEDRWRISNGFPPHDPSFRTKDPTGKEITNEAAVTAMVDKKYPGVTASSGGSAPEQIVGKTASGNTVVQRADGSRYTRPPKKGDSYAGREVTIPKGGIPVNMKELKCPTTHKG
jgi:hypothetical protein